MNRLRQTVAPPLAERISELPHRPRAALIELWTEHFGRPPPKAVSTALLLRAVAYAMQEQQLGGLNRHFLRTLLAAARKAGNDDSVARQKGRAKSSVPASGLEGQASSSAPRLKFRRRPAQRPGTRLVREWQGRRHVVDVGDKGLHWNGEVYRSLSAVASAITGARWSGNRFFGL